MVTSTSPRRTPSVPACGRKILAATTPRGTVDRMALVPGTVHLPLLAASGNSDGPGYVVMGLALSVLWFIRSWRRWRIANKMADTPTSPPSAVPAGRAESTGKVELLPGEQPVGRGQPSAWYEVKLEQHVRSGKRSYWKTMWSATSTKIFLLTDEYGHVEVDPADAEVYVGKEVVSETDLDFPIWVLAAAAGVQTPDRPVSGTSVMADIKDYRGTWRLVERFLPTMDQIATVYGPVQPTSPGASSPRFRSVPSSSRLPRRLRGRSGSDQTVHVFASDAARATRKLSLSAWAGLVLAPMLMSLCGAFVLAYFVGRVPPVLPALVLVLCYAAVAARSTLNVYNRLVAAVNRVESAWSMLDVALARRSSLLPQLSALLSESMRHEGTLQTSVASARWKPSAPRTGLDPSGVASAVSVSVSNDLRILLEKYPELRTSRDAANLQSELSRSENLIAGARLGYNDSVEIARTKLGSFPSSLFASRFKSRRAALWTC